MSHELCTVGSFATPVEADAFRLRLDAEGIRSVLADEATVGMNWLLGNAVGGVKVLVAAADFPRAEQILIDESAATTLRSSKQRLQPDWDCLHCGEAISGDFETCWACGASREGEIDPDFERQTTAEERRIDSADNVPVRTSPDDEIRAHEESFRDESANPFRSPSASFGSASVENIESEDSFDYSATDEVAFRAWKAAILGLGFCPPVLQVYSISLLAPLAFSEQALSRKAFRRCVTAWIVNLIVLGFVGAVVIAFCR